MAAATMKPKAIAAKILQLHRAGEPLNISAVKRNHPDLLAAAFSCRPFLGWEKAVELAGLEIRRQSPSRPRPAF